MPAPGQSQETAPPAVTNPDRPPAAPTYLPHRIICEPSAPVRKCRICGCTDDDCSQCIAKTGHPCLWVALDLCSACQTFPAITHSSARRTKTAATADD